MDVTASVSWVQSSVVPLAALLLLLKCLVAFIQYLGRRNRLLAIPEPAVSHWLLGHLPHFAHRLGVRQRRADWREKCPRFQRTHLSFFSTTISLVHADTASVLLRSSAPKHPFLYGFLKPWLGDGLLLSNGRKWARDRRLLTHCFHFDILSDYVEVYTDALGTMLQKWSEACENGECVDVSASCAMLTLDIILRCAMGFESNCQLETDPNSSKSARYIATVRLASIDTERRFLNPLLYSDFIYSLTSAGRTAAKNTAILHDMSTHLIAERREALSRHAHAEAERGDGGSPSQHRARDFLDVLLTVKDEDGVGLSDEEIREQVDTFLFRGHDTTASALQWTIYYLAVHQDVQEKCRREVLEVLQQSGRSVETITHEDLNEMAYLTQTLREGMRLSSPVPFIQRQVAEEVEVDGYSLPSNTACQVSIHDVHQHKESWPDPEKFDPDRFSLEQMKDRHPFAFIPFSAGPRNCIGQSMAMDEMKTTLASVVGKFRVLCDPEESTPVWRPQLVSRANENIRLRLEVV